MVARAPHQQGRLSRLLEAEGLEPVEVPLLAIDPPSDDGLGLRRAVDDLHAGTIAALAITSPNGAVALAEAIRSHDGGGVEEGVHDDAAGSPSVVLADVFVGCVGPGTAARSRDVLGVEPDLVASVHTTAGLGEQFPTPDELPHAVDGRTTVVLPRADIASEELPRVLATRGWLVRDVEAYRTRLVTEIDGDVRDALARGDIDAVAAGSPSTVDALVGALDGVPLAARLVSIGPVTSARARDHGLEVAAQADPHDLPSLVAAVVRALAGSDPGLP